MIAIHFGEEWESSCNQMCDHCSLKAQQQSNVKMFPLFSHISAIRMILERASRQDTRLTGITRLFQQWLMKVMIYSELKGKEYN